VRTPSAPPAWEGVVRLAVRLLGVPCAELVLVSGAEEVVVVAAGPGAAGPSRRARDDTSCAAAALVAGTIRVDGPRADGAPHHEEHGPEGAAVPACLAVAVTDPSGQRLGVLRACDSEPRAWSDSDVSQLTALADEAGLSTAAPSRSDSAWLELAAAAAQFGGYDLDLITGGLVWDARMLALHGYTADSFSGSIEDFDAVVHPDDLPAVQEAMAHAIKGVTELVLDYRIVTPHRGRRWVKARGRVLPGPDGRAARIVGAAYDSSGERELRDELTRLLETMPPAFVRVDRDWRITYVNAGAEALYERSRHALVGQDLWEAFPDARGTTFEAQYRQAHATGERGTVEAYFPPWDTHFQVHVWPDEQGLSFFFQDVSDSRRARRGLEQLSERLTVLSTAGARLSASLQPREVLAVLADLVVPDLGASIVLTVVDDVAVRLGMPGAGEDPRRLHPVHVQHRDEHGHRLLTDVVERLELSSTADTGVGLAVATGLAQLLSRVPDAVLVRRAVDADHLAQMRALNAGATISVPLPGPSGPLGGFTVAAAGAEPPDEVLLVDLAARAGAALHNALTYAGQRREATVLQSALLPRVVATLPGVEVATRYLPANADALAGGDFFRTVRVGDRLVLVLGDVMGHGTASAARAGQLHGLVAALALEGHGPSVLLERLAAGVTAMMDLELATLLVCSYEPTTRTLVVASAGHPPPLVAPAQGDPHYLDVDPGPPLGVVATSYAEQSVQLSAETTVVLFSDGLVERRDESITDGLERLRRAVVGLRLAPEAVADHLLEQCGSGAGSGDDDIALLVLHHA
jgi:PAS domain-containing protein